MPDLDAAAREFYMEIRALSMETGGSIENILATTHAQQRLSLNSNVTILLGTASINLAVLHSKHFIIICFYLSVNYYSL
jgi:hypothetical protein